MRFLITGGAGFIGSAMVRFLLKETGHEVLNFDKLTYAGNLESLKSFIHTPQYKFVHGDICDHKMVSQVLNEFKPDVVMHLAAESHVDRSIDEPIQFIQTNIVGTSILLECVREFWNSLGVSSRQKLQKKNSEPTRESFRFHHISTDEVYGSLGTSGLFTETTCYDPSSPYSASKAGSDHLVRAWHRTYNLPVIITNCSNNYGPYQFPEKLIPFMTLNAFNGNSLPVYGNGKNVRDWLYVEDHVRALYSVAVQGQIGETYNIGGFNEKTNLEIIYIICDILEELVPCQNGAYEDLITFVPDRPGHDQRYAIDAKKIHSFIGWKPQFTLESGIRKTIVWYLENLDWCQQILKDNPIQRRLGTRKASKLVVKS